MKSPEFWQHKSILAKSLYPCSKIYSWISSFCQFQQMKREYTSHLKVICIGNVVVGGSGKTPIAMTIARLLQKNGKKVAFLSRGYKGRLDNVIVDKKVHSATDVGDEPLLLADIAPVIIAHNRGTGAKIAEKIGIEYLIMDDGFQNHTLHKNVSFLVFDGVIGIGNGYILPAGPLREPVMSALKHATFAIVTGDDKTRISDFLSSSISVLHGSVVPTAADLYKKGRYVAFAGIGRPQKFFDTLVSSGVNVVGNFSYPDHYYYTESDMRILNKEAERLNAGLITTSKDIVKIPKEWHKSVSCYSVEFSFSNGDAERILNTLLSID